MMIQLFLSRTSSKTLTLLSPFLFSGHICSRKQHPRLLLRHERKQIYLIVISLSPVLLPVNHLTPTAGNNPSEHVLPNNVTAAKNTARLVPVVVLVVPLSFIISRSCFIGKSVVFCDIFDCIVVYFLLLIQTSACRE